MENLDEIVGEKRILVVDDEKEVRSLLYTFLEILGYKTDCAGSGEEAIERYKKGRYDLVVSDYMMPNMNGRELQENLRILNPHAKMVMVSGNGYQLSEKDRKAGIIGFSPKPFILYELQNTIEKALDYNREGDT